MTTKDELLKLAEEHEEARRFRTDTNWEIDLNHRTLATLCRAVAELMEDEDA